MRWQLIFLTRRSHKLIHIISRPVPRPVVSFRSAPRVIAPPGSPVPRLVSRPVATPRFSSRHLIISSGHLIRYRFSIVIPVVAYPIHGGETATAGGRQTGTEAGGLFFLVRRFPQLIIIRPIIRFSSSGRRLIVVVPTAGVLDGVISSSYLALFSLAPHCLPGSSWNEGSVGVRHLSSKQRHHGINPIMAVSAHRLIAIS